MKPTFFRQSSRPLVARLVATTLVPALTLVSVPMAGAAPTSTQPGAPAIRANRTLPKVRPVRLRPVFSAEPTDKELFKARVFEEPLVPVGGPTTPEENRALAGAIQAFVSAGDRLDLSPFESFLWEHGASAWRASLRLGMGIAYLRAGRFTHAAAALREAWDRAKGLGDPPSRAVADRALGELANLQMQFTQVTETELLLREAEGRRMRGSAIEQLEAARAQLAMRAETPDLIHPTGARALARILARRQRGNYRPDPRLESFRAPQYGATLTQIEALAREVGLDLRMAYHADKNATIEVPSVVHLTMGHYAAVVARDEAGTRYLLDDPSVGAIWVTRRALLEEASGYFLIPGGELPEGWHAIGKADGDRILGRCTGTPNPNNTTKQDECEGENCCGCSGGGSGGSTGLATYSFHALTINLSITDTPVGYTPPRGPGVAFQVTYNHKEAGQPGMFTYPNLGARWTFDQISFIEDDNLEALYLHPRGGGREFYSGLDGQQYPPHYKSHNVVARVQVDPVVWEVRHPDGSVDVYAQPDCSVCSGRRVFMTESRDPAGNSVTYTYDEDLRLVAITDAMGQVTTLSYELSQDPYRITRVTDPFGRFARFEYSLAGDLVRITDVLGMTSEFEYGGTERADFITAMTTPYGTTTFRQGVTDGGLSTFLEATDPLGGTERIAYDNHEFNVPADQRTPPAESYWLVPPGFEQDNHDLDIGQTHYWDKRTMALYGSDYRRAKLIRWKTDLEPGGRHAAAVKQSEKRPLESRVWYAHDGETTGIYSYEHYRGPSARPTRIARVLEDGTYQMYSRAYNSLGNKLMETDPLLRTTIYKYAANGIDLLEVRQSKGQDTELISKYTYNGHHQPLTITDASGQTTTYTYTADGQTETVATPARDGLTLAERTTTYEYYPPSDPVAPGRLKKITGPSTAQGAPTTTYTYDAIGRLRTTTDSDGYTVTYDYDALDRPTRTTYPDGTYEGTVYEKLDAVRHRDRLGRWSHTYYDALRRVVGTKNPADRTTRLEYGGSGCLSCGGGMELTALVDANGNRTQWEYDDRGRRIREIRANDEEYVYTYDTATGRLKTTADPKGNVKTIVYNRDGSLAGVTYTVGAGTAPTPNVYFTYEPVYSRVTSMTDGTGTTAYTYYPVTSPPTLGAGKLKSVDGPLDDDTIEYSYDELGRVRTRQIGSAANTQTQLFDSEGRLTTLTNTLGTFTYTYDGVSGRPATLTYPNGQMTSWAYYDNLGDHRLQEIHNKRPGGATLSKFTYTYDEVGNILTWTQQADSDPAKVYELGYDPADQLTAAVLKTVDPTPVILKRYYYSYDSAGNRTAEQIDDAVTGASYNNMNQLVSQQAGGALVFKGTVSEPATVTVGGKPGTVTADDRFEGQAVVPGGTGQVVVAATDPSGNLRTNTYEVSQGATSKSFTYDANGNMTSDGTRTYEWDAENRLVAINSNFRTYTYRGDGMRASMTRPAPPPTVGGFLTTYYVLDGSQVVEERPQPAEEQANRSPIWHFHGPRIDNVLAMKDRLGSIEYLTRDHLGSVREDMTPEGLLTLRRDYDPWGRLVAGNSAGWAFTGREWDAQTGLYYYRARYYEPGLGRFVSEDPLGPRAGTNRYLYAKNTPTVKTDPFGLYAVGDDEVCPANRFNMLDAMGNVYGRANASVCCRNGRHVPCFNYDYWVKASPTGRKCTAEHEQVHINSMLASGCTKCCQPSCTTVKCLLPDGEECAASMAKVDCLNVSGAPAAEIEDAEQGVWRDCFGHYLGL